MNTQRPPALHSNASRLLLLLVYVAFVSLGLPDGAFGVAWPSMRQDLKQAIEAAGAVTLVGTACSAVSSFASARVLGRLGTRNVVVLSGLLTGLSLLGFAVARSFTALVCFALPLGLGAGSVDAGLNHYAASHYSSRHMNWLHAAWGVGATLGPLAVTWAVSSGHGWRGGYFWIALSQLSIVGVLFLSRRLWDQGSARPSQAAPEAVPASRRSAPPLSALFLAPASYGLYVGAEGGVGVWAASILRDGRGFESSIAGSIAASYYAAITIGRVLSGVVADRVGNRRMVRGGLGLSLAGLILFAFPLGPWLAWVGLCLIGLGFSPIYPCLMHETPVRFDAVTARRVVGRQVAFSYFGGMLLPPLIGVLGDRIGLFLVAPAVAVLVALLALVIAMLDRVT